MLDSYELSTKRAEQNCVTWTANNQCWWLALLEIARANGKLDATFSEGGKLYKYFSKGGKSAPWVPTVGQVPDGIKQDDPRVRPSITKECTWEKFKKLLVYGPQWQRMVMYFLWDKNNKCAWHVPRDTMLNSDRPKELMKLLDYLGVTGITVGEARTLLVEESVPGRVNVELADKQCVLVDKTNVDKSGHSMSGVVERVGMGTEAYNKIKVYNQANPDEFVCWVRRSKTDQKLKLLSESGRTVINCFFPLTITNV